MEISKFIVSAEEWRAMTEEERIEGFEPVNSMTAASCGPKKDH